MRERTRRTVADLLELTEQSGRLVSRGKSQWDADEFLRLAGEALMLRIGEAVMRLDRDDPSFIAAHPAIGWRPMRGLRNVVAHEYGTVDHHVLWNALTVNLPREAAALRRLAVDDPGS